MALDVEDHDRGLAYDLTTMSSQLIARRRALSWLATAGGAAVLAGCGGGGSGSSATTTATAATTAATTTAATTTTATATTTTTTAATTCTTDPQATAGPYPADGTNSSEGSTSDILTISGIVRSNLRQSFISGTDTAPGADMTITVTLVDSSNSCAVLEGYAIYMWHCDANGDYSLYNAPTESYLRGVQVTDSNGQVTFLDVFPACYSGRYPHIHFEVFKDLAAATVGTNAVQTSQFPMPSDVASALYSSDSTYSASVANFKDVTLTTDNVFSAFTSAQLTAATPTITGSASAGYTATATIAIAV